MTIKHHTLGKAEKLKSRKFIEQLFAEGKGFTAFPVKVVYKTLDSQVIAVDPQGESTEMDRAKNKDFRTQSGKLITGKSQPGPVQIGVSASTRNFKKAADRNRIKRLLREAYRQQKHELTEAATAHGLQVLVFFIYLDKTLPTYDLVFDKMRYCLKRLRKTLEERP